MSYATLYHGIRSRHAVGQFKGNHSTPMVCSTGSEDGSAMDMDEQGDLDKLKDLTRSRNGSGHLRPAFGLRFEGSRSDDEEKSPSFVRSRRASGSPPQSFMLYTQDKERSVVRKFDSGLVLFVAIL